MVRNRAPGTAFAPDPVSAVDILHGRPVPDPYRWLETADSAQTLRWLEDRGREYERESADWPLREHLAELIRSLVDTDLWSPPVHRPGAVFATVRTAGSEHPRLVVLAADAAPHTVHDPVAEDPSGRTTLDAWEPSPDGSLVAVQTSSGGVERGGLRVVRTGTGVGVGPPVPGVRYSHVAWVPEGTPSFYYVRRDGELGVRGVWLRRVADGTETLVHSCTAPSTVPGVRILGNRWLLVTEGHGTGHRTDLWLADLATGSPQRPALRPVQVDVEGETEARMGPDGLLYLRTTLGAPWRRICVVSPGNPGVEHWREVVPEESGATLDAFTPCSGAPGGGPALFVSRTRLGISRAAVHDARSGDPLYTVELPGEGMVSAPRTAPDGSVYLGYADVAAQQRILCLPPGERVPRSWPPGTTPPDSPAVERAVVWCRSEDGTRVPVTVFTAVGAGARPTPQGGSPLPRTEPANPVPEGNGPLPGSGSASPCVRQASGPASGPGPTILHAYGGFGRPRQFGFSATVLAWLLSGGRYAVAHVRGGGDAGREWHLAGSGRDKPRALEDLIAAADTLVATGLCTRGQLCLSGGSAGGLLVLAAATARPDLCGSVIASAPLADMVRFERMGLGRMWTREFGTAADPDDFAALMSYSPYHRALDSAVHAPGGHFPSVLLTGFHGDTRTDAAHPRKMCAALLALARGEGRPPALLRYERDVGHGPRAVSRAVGLAADAHAFAAHRTGLSPR